MGEWGLGTKQGRAASGAGVLVSGEGSMMVPCKAECHRKLEADDANAVASTAPLTLHMRVARFGFICRPSESRAEGSVEQYRHPTTIMVFAMRPCVCVYNSLIA